MKKLICILAIMCLCAIAAFGGIAETTNEIYVLMNIPYADFYANETTNGADMDAVSSATLNKPRTGSLAGGSYHTDPAGSDISGIIFPVELTVGELDKLSELGGIEITDESYVDVTVTNKGSETTTRYEGKAALFEAPDYSWYVLSEKPAQYKTVVLENGTAIFGAIQTEPAELEGTAMFIYDRHADMTISVSVSGDELNDQDISAVILRADDGTRVGLKHVVNIWRKTLLGFAWDGDVYETLKGKRIQQIIYITLDNSYVINTDLLVSDDELLPMLNGTYIDLFPEFAKEDYKDYWMECISAYVDDDATAEAYYIAMTQGFMGTLKGEAAIEAFSADPASMIFDCYIENGLKSVTVNGDVISGKDSEGNTVFSHAYSYLENVEVTFFGQPMGTELRVYATQDEDAGMFTYFAFADDTIAETQHVEFRYGETLENMGSYDQGEYAYWLAGAINDNYKDNQIKDCIKLFVTENLGEED